MSATFHTVDQLRTFAAGMRGRAGIVAVPAVLYRDFAVNTAMAVADDPALASTDEDFLRDVCAGIDGLGGDVDRRIYVPTEILYRLSCFPAPPPPPAAGPQLPATPPPDVPPQEPAEIATEADTTPKPRRKRKPKSNA